MELIRCQHCNQPLAKREGRTTRIITNHGGERSPIDIEIQHSKGGAESIKCPKCDRYEHFITLIAKECGDLLPKKQE